MDLFTGAVGSGQTHDFNPGIRPSGLFWTQPVSSDALEVDLEEGEASLALKDIDEEDFHNLHNSPALPSQRPRQRNVRNALEYPQYFRDLKT
jgi:hypothetical protein